MKPMAEEMTPQTPAQPLKERLPYERPFYVRPTLKDFVELAQRKHLAQQARHTMENAMTVCIIAPGSSGECLGDRLEKRLANA